MLADLIPKLAALDQEEDHTYYPRPSMASPATPEDPGRCIRAMTYARLGSRPAPWPGRFLLVLDDSSWHEELTLDWLAKGAHSIHSRQMPVDLPLPRPIGPGGYCRLCTQEIPNTVLHGHIDALFTDLLAHDRLLEHKAVSMYTFDDMLTGTPSLDHLTQGCIYLGALQRVNPDLNEGVLLVKNKNSSAYLEFRFTYHAENDRCHVFEMTASQGIHLTLDLTFDGLLARALEKFESVEQHAATNSLPVRPYRMDSWRCHYCRFQRTCWDGYPAEVDARDAIATLDPTVAPLLAQYAEASTMKRLAEVTTKRLRPEILAALEAQHVKTGVANGHRATVSIQPRTTLDESLIPPDIKQAAQVTKSIEILRVTASHTREAAHPEQGA